MKIHTFLATFILGCSLAVAPASASLIGSKVSSVFQSSFSLYSGDNLWDGVAGAMVDTPLPAVIGAGNEYAVPLGRNFFADLGADTLELVMTSGEVLDGLGAKLSYDFFGLTSSAGNIVDVQLLFSDFHDVAWTWTADSIHIEIPDQSTPGTYLSSKFLIVTAVPEPGTLALLSLGLACIGFGRRARGK